MTRILIVEDSEELQDTYEALLTDEGYAVDRASDGGAALRSVERWHPDIVLLDLMMPDVDGLQFLARMPNECSAPFPVVIASSAFPVGDEALHRGARVFLGKPVEIDVLTATLRAAAQREPVAAEVVQDNQLDVTAARARAERATSALVANLPPTALQPIRGRLRALVEWLQRYYGFGATFLQILRDQELCIEAAYGAKPPWVEGHCYARNLAYCNDVVAAGSTIVLCDPVHHPASHYAFHAELAAGWHFYAGAPLTTPTGAIIGTLSFRDREPHLLHAEDMRLLEALGLRVARTLEQVANGSAPDELVDDDGLFAPELLPLFVDIGAQRASRIGGVVNVSVVELENDGDAGAATRACYASGRGPGFAVVHRAEGELALVAVGREAEARQRLANAVAACRRAVSVRATNTTS
jgi:two-component system, OmpR family, response regulator VanR